LNRVLRYVNWTAKKGLKKGSSYFADSICGAHPKIVAACRRGPTFLRGIHGKRNPLRL
jgi:hypothetical protein